MRAQFVKDDNGKIFFSYVKDLYVRKIPFDYERHYIMQEVQNINDQAKDNLISEINGHIDKTKSPKAIHTIYTVMNHHFGNIKNKVGVGNLEKDEFLENEDDLITEDAYKTLRPNSPYKLNELIHKRKFTPK